MLGEHELHHRLCQLGREANETRQLAERLAKLLPLRLHAFKQEWRQKASSARALRQALCDPRYQAIVDELVRIRSYARRARILWEIKEMQIKTLRSSHTRRTTRL